MKYMGQNPRTCDCRYCVGNNDSKTVRRCKKKRFRQKLKKELRKELNEDPELTNKHTGSDLDSILDD